MLWDKLKEAALKFDRNEITLDQFRSVMREIANDSSDMDCEDFALTVSDNAHQFRFRSEYYLD